jgi:hypothetical protein
MRLSFNVIGASWNLVVVLWLFSLGDPMALRMCAKYCELLVVLALW